MPFYEVLNKGHHVTENGQERVAQPGEIVELPERAALPLVPWRLKPRPDLDAMLEKTDVERAVEAGAEGVGGTTVVTEGASADTATDSPELLENVVDWGPDEIPLPHAEATEAALVLAYEHGIDLARVEGSGQEGRILKKDVEAVIGGYS